MGNEKVMNRWLVVIGAILIQLCLGAIYAWSVFTTTLKASPDDGGYGFTATQTQWIFSTGLAVFALVMLFAGAGRPKSGPGPSPPSVASCWGRVISSVVCWARASGHR